MENPFKFGTLVEGPYFTDRVEELEYIKNYIESPNHLILISPRRFGKSSLVKKAVESTGRPSISVNMQQVTSIEDLASLILKGIFKLNRIEKFKHYISMFRIVPVITTSPMSDNVEFSFNPTISASKMILEDTMNLLEKISEENNRIVVIFDEFQEITELEKGLDKRLRAIMQEQHNINYIFLGSQESMMSEIFEHVKSPFYHFGTLMHLNKIPYDDFFRYITERISSLAEKDSEIIAEKILAFTKCHPYYTQQLSARVWEILALNRKEEEIVNMAISQIVQSHDLDFERLWQMLNRTDRRIMQILAKDDLLKNVKSLPTSTVYSSVKKLMKKGYVISTVNYEIEDPFYKKWITENVPFV